jgi:hypothetical protein
MAENNTSSKSRQIANDISSGVIASIKAKYKLDDMLQAKIDNAIINELSSVPEDTLVKNSRNINNDLIDSLQKLQTTGSKIQRAFGKIFGFKTKFRISDKNIKTNVENAVSKNLMKLIDGLGLPTYQGMQQPPIDNPPPYFGPGNEPGRNVTSRTPPSYKDVVRQQAQEAIAASTAVSAKNNPKNPPPSYEKSQADHKNKRSSGRTKT